MNDVHLQIAACQSLIAHFPQFVKFKHATDAQMLDSGSIMEAAFECSRFSDDLLDRIKKLFSPESMSSVVLYKEAPSVSFFTFRYVTFTSFIKCGRD